jgi:hypothetical protein
LIISNPDLRIEAKLTKFFTFIQKYPTLMTYCEYIRTIGGDQFKLHKEYHDNHYGFPLNDDNRLFGRLMFEINQAGLNLEKLKNQNEKKGPTN